MLFLMFFLPLIGDHLRGPGQESRNVPSPSYTWSYVQVSEHWTKRLAELHKSKLFCRTVDVAIRRAAATETRRPLTLSSSIGKLFCYFLLSFSCLFFCVMLRFVFVSNINMLLSLSQQNTVRSWNLYNKKLANSQNQSRIDCSFF